MRSPSFSCICFRLWCRRRNINSPNVLTNCIIFAQSSPKWVGGQANVYCTNLMESDRKNSFAPDFNSNNTPPLPIKSPLSALTIDVELKNKQTRCSCTRASANPKKKFVTKFFSPMHARTHANGICIFGICATVHRHMTCDQPEKQINFRICYCRCRRRRRRRCLRSPTVQLTWFPFARIIKFALCRV